MFVIVVALGLLVHFLEPVVLQYNSAASAEGSFAVVIVRTLMGPVGEVIAIADAIVECVDFHTDESIEKRLTHKGRDCFNCSKFILDVDIDAEWGGGYTTSATLESLVGAGS